MKRLLLLAAVMLALVAAKSRNDAYIIKIDDVTTISGADVDSIVAIHEAYPGPFFWARRNGRDYLVRDAAFIARVRALFAPQMALAPQQEAIGKEEERLDREEERLEDAPRTAANEKRLAEVREKQRALAKREQALDEREREIELAAERALWPMVDDAVRTGMAKALKR